MKNQLEQTWRWYGPEDPVSLQDAKQAGATGIVTALHHIPHGEIWTVSEINKRKKIISDSGLVWSVVESVPVHEAIKTGTENANYYIENYRQTLKNLSDCGINIICYNFMPVLDWTRTRLDLEMRDGSKALSFNWVDLALFDIHILQRSNAAADYPKAILNEVEIKIANISTESKKTLSENILLGIPGESNISLENLRESIDTYSQLGADGLRNNLKRFLESIADVCNENNIQMTIHPDDPPFPILGLPRIVSNEKDFEFILNAVHQPFNGVCFCTGSLGAGNPHDILSIFNKVKERINFVHLRNVKKDETGNFYEADHLSGDVDMYEIMRAIISENQKRDKPIPFRPDHGHQMLDDLHKITLPGYSAIGRLRGLAELRGLELGILRSL